LQSPPHRRILVDLVPEGTLSHWNYRTLI